MITLAIDYGEKRIGLATAGRESGRSQRLKVLANTADLFEDIEDVIKRQEVEVVVVGLPRNLDGDDTAQTKVVREFSAALQQRCPAVRVELQDEAMTSEVAKERLEREGLQGEELKRWLDAEAAAVILEDYLGAA